MALDLTTLYLVNVTICFVSGGAFYLSWHYHRDNPGLRSWALGLIVGGIGALLLGLRGTLSDTLLSTVANTGIVAGFVILWVSVRRFNTGGLGLAPGLAVVSAFVVIYVVARLTNAASRLPAAVVVGFVAVICLLAAREVMAGAKSEPLRSRLPTGIAFALLGIVLLGRALFLALNSKVPLDYILTYDLSRGVAMLAVAIGLMALNLCMLTMANERLRNRYEALASTDALTGISNRRVLLEKGERLSHRAVIGSIPVCVLLMDLDHFKAINHRFGHEGGDRTLKAFAAYVDAQLRPTDLFGRYGGEEFCALLPETNVAQGTEIAERLRAGLEKLIIQISDQKTSITVSVGVSPLLSGDLKTSIREADIALYRAKELGRNRVCTRGPVTA
jgi:diguanylate cyclase (GGDEF)-like protein